MKGNLCLHSSKKNRRRGGGGGRNVDKGGHESASFLGPMIKKFPPTQGRGGESREREIERGEGTWGGEEEEELIRYLPT